MLSIQRLSIDDATALIAGAKEKASAIGVPVCIAVVDESGHLLAFVRMDGAKFTSTQLAQDKAFAAAGMRRGTHEVNAVAVPGSLAFGIGSAWNGRLTTVGGGLPVIVNGVTVGAIGVSAGTPQQDIDCAEAGIAHWRAGAGT